MEDARSALAFHMADGEELPLLLTSAVLMKCPCSGDGGTRDVFIPELAVQHFIKSTTSPKILLGDSSVNRARFSRFYTPESPITITDRGDAVGERDGRWQGSIPRVPVPASCGASLAARSAIASCLPRW